MNHLQRLTRQLRQSLWRKIGTPGWNGECVVVNGTMFFANAVVGEQERRTLVRRCQYGGRKGRRARVRLWRLVVRSF